MLDIKIKIDTRQVDGLAKDFKKGLSKAIVRAMLFAEGEAKQIFKEGGPVHPTILTARTGHLRRSIRSGIEGSIGWVGSNIKYAALHELGLGKMPKRPFLAPSFSGKNLDKICDIIANGIVKEMT